VYETNVDFYYTWSQGPIISINRGASPYNRMIILPVPLNGAIIYVVKSTSATPFNVNVSFPAGTFYDLTNTSLTSPITLLSSSQYRATLICARDIYYLVARV
jgi:hypothetical protein